MPTSRETILTALHARLSALPATALRGEVLPERVPAADLLILRDGEPGEPEVTLSPLRYPGHDLRAARRLDAGAAVTGWIAAILTKGMARKILGLLLVAVTILLLLVNLRRASERAGRLATRLQASENAHDIQREMLDAASRRPHDGDALAERLRDGRF
ncbi:hypothetical protein [Primorskyibacter flagellatus]|uniref:hypothetical protein n=1 Tax=Primorskyibacter flagellatus TaxID=1387277 RepID=UPI003A91C266